ncbi:HNH endonuclease [Micromonospora wenchangensis]|uniref:HNH endonuclease n=1 Tax=Micromonospora wenchangensis TaxID=1185415 RepID=UPI0037FF1F06
MLLIENGTSEPRRLRGTISPQGYRQLYIADHPLVPTKGMVFEHRAVMWTVLGDGMHSCHWCGQDLYWFGSFPNKLIVDHIDGNRLNNAPANLVPACKTCNGSRDTLAVSAGMRTDRACRVCTLPRSWWNEQDSLYRRQGRDCPDDMRAFLSTVPDSWV